MDRFSSPYCSGSYDHLYGTAEPWSRQRTIATWTVTGICLVALAIGLPLARTANERSWCSGGVGSPPSQHCLEDQEAIRCGPLGIFHCPAD